MRFVNTPCCLMWFGLEQNYSVDRGKVKYILMLLYGLLQMFKNSHEEKELFYV